MREAWLIFTFKRDPVGFLRRRGAQIGRNLVLVSPNRHTFGSEPYLVKIGDDVELSNDVQILTHDGGLWAVRERYPGAYVYRPVTIGNRVFVGARVTILPGVTIGNGAVIGAGAMVTKDVRPHMVVAGVPARELKSVEEYALSSRDQWLNTSGMEEQAKRAMILQHVNRNERARDKV